MSPSDAACEMTALAGRSAGSPTQCNNPHQNQFGSPVKQTRPKRQRCRPTLGCLLLTAFFTIVGTAALTASIFTDYWERIDYNATAIEMIARRHNGSHRLTWLFNSTVARIVLHPAGSSHSSSAAADASAGIKSSRTWALKRTGTNFSSTSSTNRPASTTTEELSDHYVNSIDRNAPLPSPSPQPTKKVKRSSSSLELLEGAQQQQRRLLLFNKSQQRRKKRSRKDPPGFVYLIPLYGGIWHLCVDLYSEQFKTLKEMGLNREEACVDYLNHSYETAEVAATPVSRLSAQYLHYHVQSKMHNLSISCATVCVILLASAALLGAFGIIKRQLSAVLVTGVMYVLAALFAVFSLVIMHCKRNARQESGIVDELLVASTDYNESRIFSNSWSMLLGWIGSFLILIASFFWLFLAKVMRYNPLTLF